MMKNQNLFLSVIGFFSICIIGYGQPLEDDDKGDLVSYIEQAKLLTIPSYNEAYARLKDLYLKRQESASFRKSDELLRKFIKKSNIAYPELQKLTAQQKGILDWVSENLELTTFEDFEDAKAQYEEYSEANNKEYEENQDFHIYAFAAMDKFGSQIFSNVLMDCDMDMENPNSAINRNLNSRELELDIKYWTEPKEKP